MTCILYVNIYTWTSIQFNKRNIILKTSIIFFTQNFRYFFSPLAPFPGGGINWFSIIPQICIPCPSLSSRSIPSLEIYTLDIHRAPPSCGKFVGPRPTIFNIILFALRPRAGGSMSVYREVYSGGVQLLYRRCALETWVV